MRVEYRRLQQSKQADGLQTPRPGKNRRTPQQLQAYPDLQSPSQQRKAAEHTATRLYYDMGSTGELGDAATGLQQAPQIQAACSCDMRAARQPGSCSDRGSAAAGAISTLVGVLTRKTSSQRRFVVAAATRHQARWYIRRLGVATGWPPGRPACKRARGVLYRGVRPVPAGRPWPGWGTANR